MNKVTADKWFFITTLYGEMSLEGQRTHIGKYFPRLFVVAATRDLRNLVSDGRVRRAAITLDVVPD